MVVQITFDLVGYNYKPIAPYFVTQYYCVCAKNIVFMLKHGTLQRTPTEPVPRFCGN